MIKKGKYILFFQDIFSNWHFSDFHEKGQKFICVEQYMMYRKAVLFEDMVSARSIMKANHPHDHKQLGRRVSNFNQDVWDKHKFDIVYRGVYLKFTQNSKLLRELMISDVDDIFVEASPYDDIWGVKLKMTDPRILDESKWKGQNLLGKIISMVRQDIENVPMLIERGRQWK